MVTFPLEKINIAATLINQAPVVLNAPLSTFIEGTSGPFLRGWIPPKIASVSDIYEPPRAIFEEAPKCLRSLITSSAWKIIGHSYISCGKTMLSHIDFTRKHSDLRWFKHLWKQWFGEIVIPVGNDKHYRNNWNHLSNRTEPSHIYIIYIIYIYNFIYIYIYVTCSRPYFSMLNLCPQRPAGFTWFYCTIFSWRWLFDL